MEAKTAIFIAFCLLLMPFSAFAQSGELTGLSVEKDAYSTGDGVMVLASFRNTGSDNVQARLNVEIYLDGELVSAASGKDVTIYPGNDVMLQVQYKPERIGLYTARGTVFFSGEVTEAREVRFPVVSKNISMELEDDITVPLMVDGLLALVIVAGVIMLKRRRR